MRWYPRSYDTSLPSIVPASLFSFSRPRRRSRKDAEIGRSWWKAKWSWLLRIGIFRNESAGSRVSGPCSCGGSPCTRRTALTPRRFDGEDVREQGIAGVIRWAAERFWEGSASLHEPFDLPLCHHFPVQFVQPAASREFLNTSNHFHALEMATFAFKSQYTYKPTPPRPKSTATRRKPALEQVSILNKLQHIRSSSASLSTLRPAVAAADDDDNGGYGPGIRGM